MSVLVGGVDKTTHFTVDHLSRLLRIRLLQDHFSRLRHIETNVTNFGIHAKLNDLSVGALCYLPQIVLGTCGDSAEKDLLRHSAAQRHAHTIKQLLCRVQVLFSGQILGVTKSFATRDDRNLQSDRQI